MDFVNRLTPNHSQSTRPSSSDQFGAAPAKSSHDSQKSSKDFLSLGSRIGTNILLIAVALLIASLAWLTYASRPASQANLIDTSKLQAVFLNTGQVYFGNISELNKDYLVLHNVYYLQSQQTTATNAKNAASSLSLIKLGCELHQPYDSMIVNTTQVTFWENLKSTGQVATAVSQFKQQHPNGQTCSDASASNSSSNNLQNAPSSKSSSSSNQ